MKTVKLVTLACLALPALASADYIIQDGKNVMTIGGQLRSEFTTGRFQVDGAPSRFSEVNVNTANLHFGGTINEKIVYKMRLKLAPQNTETTDTATSGTDHDHNTYNMIDYAYAGYQFMPQLTVMIGKVPWGVGFDNQSSAMSPLSFSQDLDLFIGSGTTNGILATGALTDNIDWVATAANSIEDTQAHSNDNRSMDYVFTLAHHTKDAADAEGYNAEGDFKSYVAVDFAKINRNDGENRKIYAATGFFSYQNMILHTAATVENTVGRKDDFWTVGAGYLFNKTWRPAITYSSVRSTAAMDAAFGDPAATGRNAMIAANLTQFHDDNKWRSYVELSTLTKSDDVKKNNTDAQIKNETSWAVSVGLTVNL